MPLLSASSYTMPFPFTNGHVQTLYPPLFRTVPDAPARRERLDTADGDFLDMDFLPCGAYGAPLAVISHGLEGHSRRKYVRGMARCLNAHGWDVCAWNFRGCSGEPNRTVRMYHSGVTDDLHSVVTHCAGLGYAAIALVGFSMGGNQILKYLGERPDAVHPAVAASVTFSVPCDLVGAAQVLDRPSNIIYMRYFMHSLRQKMVQKKAVFPEMPSIEGLESMRTFREFDNRFTAPLHGFRDARDYWERCGCGQFLRRVRVPSLLVNAVNDPFLSPSCYPVHVAEQSAALFLEMPRTGGHVGFVRSREDGYYWSDLRAAAFLGEVMGMQMPQGL